MMLIAVFFGRSIELITRCLTNVFQLKYFFDRQISLEMLLRFSKGMKFTKSVNDQYYKFQSIALIIWLHTQCLILETTEVVA